MRLVRAVFLIPAVTDRTFGFIYKVSARCSNENEAGSKVSAHCSYANEAGKASEPRSSIRNSGVLWPCHALIVDGSNVLCTAASDVNSSSWSVKPRDSTASRSPNYLAHCFAVWLRYLRRLTPAWQAYVVFDDKGQDPLGDGESGTSKSERQQAVPRYLEKRHKKKGSKVRRAEPKSTASYSSRMSAFVREAEAAGFTVLWSAPGLEADDMIGSVSAKLLASLPSIMPSSAMVDSPFTVVVASGDSDMQQLLHLGSAPMPVSALGPTKSS
eukprot:gene2686-12921_t